MSNEEAPMSKSVKSVKNSLKFKANVKPGLLSVRVGTKKYVLPVPVRILNDGDFIFLSFSASSEMYRIKNKQLSAMKADEDASDAYAVLNPGRKKASRKRSAAVELPAALADALKRVPVGFKLGYDASGQPRLVKRRERRKK